MEQQERRGFSSRVLDLSGQMAWRLIKNEIYLYGIPLRSILSLTADMFVTFGGPENRTLFMMDSLNSTILKVD